VRLVVPPRGLSLLAFDVNRVRVAGVTELLELERTPAVLASLRRLVVAGAADAAAKSYRNTSGVRHGSQIEGIEGGEV
jgi:hypothetical protein